MRAPPRRFDGLVLQLSTIARVCSVRINTAAAGPGGAWTTGTVHPASARRTGRYAGRTPPSGSRCGPVHHGEGSALRRAVVRIGRAGQEWLKGTPSLTSVA